MNPSFEAPLSALLCDATRVVGLLKKRAKLPLDYTVDNLRPCYDDEVFDLHNSLFEISRHDFDARLCENNTAELVYCRKTSTVVVHDDKVRGAAIFLPPHSKGEIWLFAVIVHYSSRKSWVTPVLKMSAFDAAISVGCRTLLFQAFNSNQDTIRNGQRSGAIRAPDLD